MKRRKLTKKEWYKVAKHLHIAIKHLNIIRELIALTCTRSESFALNVLSKSMMSTVEWVIRKASKQGKLTDKTHHILDIKIEQWKKEEYGH